jgi:hypothetical protein
MVKNELFQKSFSVKNLLTIRENIWEKILSPIYQLSFFSEKYEAYFLITLPLLV